MWIFFDLKYSFILSRRKSPISASFLLPLASVSSVVASKSWPAPSATTITAWWRSIILFSKCSKNPFGPFNSKGTSGIRQKFVSWLAIAVSVAIKPDSRPISFTRPIPLIWLKASIWIEETASVARWTAVSKPKERSINKRSLSTVLGIPTTETFKPRLSISFAISSEPRWVPSPPIIKSIFIFNDSMASTISAVRFPPPRLVPKKEPPILWISSTESGFKSIVSKPLSGKNPLKPNLKPRIFFTP